MSQGTADLLEFVPGVWAEPSGGGTGANSLVRGMPSEGDAPLVTMRLEGSPLFPPPTLCFLDNATLLQAVQPGVDGPPLVSPSRGMSAGHMRMPRVVHDGVTPRSGRCHEA